MKYFFIFFLVPYLLLANSSKLIIDSYKFEGNDIKGISIFTGNVKLKRDQDRLNSDKLEIYRTPKNKNFKNRVVLKYIATGNVSFTIISLKKHYEGKGDKLIYYPQKQQYQIIGNGYIIEKNEDREIYGDKIYIDQITEEAKVIGSENKPVRFILKIKDNKKSHKANK